MSVTAGLDVTLYNRKGEPLKASEIVQMIISNNWEIQSNGVICYLPINDNERYDWSDEALEITKFMDIIRQKEALGEIIGVIITWKGTDIGGSLRISSDSKVAFDFTINRKKIALKSADITDVNWYLEKFLPCFETENVSVEGFTFSQII